MNPCRILVIAAFTAVIVPCLAINARANERHFTYTYETATLTAGTAEIEPWATVRGGREDYYFAVDNRLEFEVGLTDHLQTALYVNFSGVGQDEVSDTGEEVFVSEFEYQGISSEWKYQFLDPVADALGLALYGEVTAAPEEYELEAKVLLDKRIGSFLVAGNLIFEQEWELGADEVESEQGVEATASFGYFVTNNLVVGLEVVNRNKIETEEEPSGEEETELEYSTLHIGPSVSWSAESYWISATVLPQVAAFAGASDDDIRDLEHNEMVEGRILMGFHL